MAKPPVGQQLSAESHKEVFSAQYCFVLFINDLPETVDSEVFLFADDTKLYRRIVNANDHHILQDDLDRLQNWSKHLVTPLSPG